METFSITAGTPACAQVAGRLRVGSAEAVPAISTTRYAAIAATTSLIEEAS
jgi:hypothetical protein